MPTRRQLANAIRALSMDAVQKANSGHPGMPMGMADIAQVLWTDHLKHNPGNPEWADRDRFVLSNGHGSMLLYSLLHLTGYPLTIDDLAQLPAVRLAHGGPPGGRPAPRHRDDDRPPRPGSRQCRRHGAGGEAARRLVQPARARNRRPPHLRVPRRRLPDGRRVARSLFAGRHAQARQARSASTTTTASRSTVKCTAGSPTTRRSGSKRTAGMSCRRSTATMPPRSKPPSRRRKRIRVRR